SGARAEGRDSIGPFGALLSNNDVINGQMNALAIDPRDANILYAGAAEGGVWKTSNGGASWTPLTDTQLGPEQGCRELSLPAPFVSLGVEQATADRLAEYIIVERLFGITLGVVEENSLNERRIHNVQSLQPEPPIKHGWLFVAILAPA